MKATVDATYCELMYAHYAEQLLTCDDPSRKLFLEESQNFYQALHEKYVSFDRVIAGIETIHVFDKGNSVVLNLYKQIALERATRSKPDETLLTIVTAKNIIKVYSSDGVLMAYVKVPGI